MPDVSRQLQQIPGIGPSMAQDLIDLDISRINDLKGRDPEEMYQSLCWMRGSQLDRCVLYVFRLAVYYAENERHDPEALKWWNWKDDKLVAG